MKYERIRRAAMSQPWAIQPEKLEAMLEFLAGRIASDDQLAAIQAAALESKQRAADLRSTPGSVAVLPLYGLISHRASMVDNMSGPGGTSTAKFGQALWGAVNDPSVKAIVIDCDSPGGTVEGVQELADDIMRARAKKPITAIADCCMASAAYWICSAASEIVASPSSSVGSIGVFCAHEDYSASLDAEGVKVSLISAGKYKTEGNPYQPLDDAARASMQSTVDHFYSMFINSVAAGRGIAASKVMDRYGQGRMLPAADALKAGMVDRVATLDGVLTKMGTARSGAQAVVTSGNLTILPDNLTYTYIGTDYPSNASVTYNVKTFSSAPPLAAAACTCDCPECIDGDCSACSDVGCTCEGCTCESASAKTAITGPKSLDYDRLRLAEAY